jgi:hypothetical protein
MPKSLLARGSWAETKRFAEILRKETVGGLLLLFAASVALVWANSPWSATYRHMAEFVVGPDSLHLNLSLASWASDGLLAIFFFVVGVELKREFVAGDLRDPARAALPIAAAVGGMVVPAGIFITISLVGGQPENLDGWAVPIATDIAFALAVLAVLSTHLPTAAGCLRLPFNGACGSGGCCCRWRSARGVSCTPAVSMRQWPVSCWASRFRCWVHVHPRNTSSMHYDRSPQASPCPSSHSSPPG